MWGSLRNNREINRHRAHIFERGEIAAEAQETLGELREAAENLSSFAVFLDLDEEERFTEHSDIALLDFAYNRIALLVYRQEAIVERLIQDVIDLEHHFQQLHSQWARPYDYRRHPNADFGWRFRQPRPEDQRCHLPDFSDN